MAAPSDNPSVPLGHRFRCDVSYIEARAVISVRGDIDIATSSELLREIETVLVRPIRALVLDLGYVAFMDSSGVAALVAARKQARDRGLVLSLTAVPRAVRLVLEVSGLSERFGLAEGPQPLP